MAHFSGWLSFSHLKTWKKLIFPLQGKKPPPKQNKKKVKPAQSKTTHSPHHRILNEIRLAGIQEGDLIQPFQSKASFRFASHCSELCPNTMSNNGDFTKTTHQALGRNLVYVGDTRCSILSSMQPPSFLLQGVSEDFSFSEQSSQGDASSLGSEVKTKI